jgi:hypothetical protein
MFLEVIYMGMKYIIKCLYFMGVVNLHVVYAIHLFADLLRICIFYKLTLELQITLSPFLYSSVYSYVIITKIDVLRIMNKDNIYEGLILSHDNYFFPHI